MNRQTKAYRKLNKSTKVVKGANVANGDALVFVEFAKGTQRSKRTSPWRGASNVRQRAKED